MQPLVVASVLKPRCQCGCRAQAGRVHDRIIQNQRHQHFANDRRFRRFAAKQHASDQQSRQALNRFIFREPIMQRIMQLVNARKCALHLAESAPNQKTGAVNARQRAKLCHRIALGLRDLRNAHEFRDRCATTRLTHVMCRRNRRGKFKQLRELKRCAPRQHPRGANMR